MGRPFVLQSEELDPAAAAWLRERCDLTACHFSDAAFAGLLTQAEGLVVRTYTRVDGGLLDKAPRLRVVGRAGVGLDRIDVAECRRRGIEVVHTPDANTQAVAEYVFALLLDCLRPRRYLQAAIDPSAWNAARRELEAPRQLNELTLGVLGMGRVGSRVARIGAGFGMAVLYNDLIEVPSENRWGAQPVELGELLSRADIVTIHIDSRPGNKGFVNAAVLGQLRKTVIVVNTSRGLVVDAAALAAFLRATPAARALIDVHEPEPFGAAYPLLGLENARLLPHLAAATAMAHANMSWVVKDVWRVLTGEKPGHPAP